MRKILAGSTFHGLLGVRLGFDCLWGVWMYSWHSEACRWSTRHCVSVDSLDEKQSNQKCLIYIADTCSASFILWYQRSISSTFCRSLVLEPKFCRRHGLFCRSSPNPWPNPLHPSKINTNPTVTTPLLTGKANSGQNGELVAEKAKRVAEGVCFVVNVKEECLSWHGWVFFTIFELTIVSTYFYAFSSYKSISCVLFGTVHLPAMLRWQWWSQQTKAGHRIGAWVQGTEVFDPQRLWQKKMEKPPTHRFWMDLLYFRLVQIGFLLGVLTQRHMKITMVSLLHGFVGTPFGRASPPGFDALVLEYADMLESASQIPEMQTSLPVLFIFFGGGRGWSWTSNGILSFSEFKT